MGGSAPLIVKWRALAPLLSPLLIKVKEIYRYKGSKKHSVIFLEYKLGTKILVS